MNAIRTISEQDVAAFATIVEQTFGLSFAGNELANLSVVLAVRVEATKMGCPAAYLERLKSAWRDEVRLLASVLTVTESFFFRGPEQFAALIETALPALRSADRTRPIRIVSAGCAGGQEPFSIAIALLEQARTELQVFR